MVTVSLCMIVKNEEAVLARCLNSVKDIVDEIIIVDTGSTDKTKEIASSFTEKIYDFPWIDDFSAARNYSFEKATMDYCFWLDADDIVPEKSREDILFLKKTLSSDTDIVMMKYETGFDESGKPTYTYYRERFIRNYKGFLWQGAIHEVIPPRGVLFYSEIAIEHRKIAPGDPDRNIRIFEKMLKDGKTLNPREQYYYGRELFYHKRYEECISILETFLAGGMGWVENEIEACSFISFSYGRLGEERESLLALFRSFEFDAPRAEICCNIGKYFMGKEHWKTAVHWYQTALTAERGKGFVQEDCYDYVPYIELCVCYDHLGDSKKAEAYNEMAGRIKPQSKAVAYNRAYFSSK